MYALGILISLVGKLRTQLTSNLIFYILIQLLQIRVLKSTRYYNQNIITPNIYLRQIDQLVGKLRTQLISNFILYILIQLFKLYSINRVYYQVIYLYIYSSIPNLLTTIFIYYLYFRYLLIIVDPTLRKTISSITISYKST